MNLRLYIDIKSPACRLAHAPVLALVQETGCALEWQPLPVSARWSLPCQKAQETRSETHIRVRAAYYRHDWQRHAERQGVSLCFPAAPPGTDTALMALLWMQRAGFDTDVQSAFLLHAYQAYWGGEGFNLNEQVLVEGLLARCDCATDGFAAFCADAGPRQMAAVGDAANELGIFDVPSFALPDEFVMGRQHLPYLRWVLGGRVGNAPESQY